MNTSKKTSLLFLILLIPGVAMLVGSGYLIKDNAVFLLNSSKAEGTVVDILSESSGNGKFYYAPKISYFDSTGQKIVFDSKQFSSSNNKPTYSIGEKVLIAYNQENPNEAKIDSFSNLWLMPLILLVVGLIFTLIGFGNINDSIISPLRKSYLRKKLINYGSRIVAKVTSIDANAYLIGETANTYIVTAQWLNPKDNKMYVFKSENITYDPKGMIKDNEVSVYIDPDMPKKYYIDLSNLPKSGN